MLATGLALGSGRDPASHEGGREWQTVPRSSSGLHTFVHGHVQLCTDAIEITHTCPHTCTCTHSQEKVRYNSESIKLAKPSPEDNSQCWLRCLEPGICRLSCEKINGHTRSGRYFGNLGSKPQGCSVSLTQSPACLKVCHGEIILKTKLPIHFSGVVLES